MELSQSQMAAAALLQSVQPEVQKYLEAVYAVAPVPEEYVKYRLHLATALPLELLDCWFELRRQTPPGFLDGVLTPKVTNGAALGGRPQSQADDANDRPNGPAFSLFGPPAQPNGLPKVLSAQHPGDGEDQAARNRLPHPPEPRSRNTEAGAPKATGPRQAVADDSSSGDDSHTHATRFTEADLDAISSLVGLESLTSTQEHCGSSSLFMFEQLTALDSLETDNRGGGAKRKRTRHQHFWRNTDKLDATERVYIPTASIKPALRRNEPVVPKSEISPEERTNAWTVCLTTRGVVSYLNKRISPLGVQLIRALQKGSQQRPPPPQPAPRSAFQGSGRVVPRVAEQPASITGPHDGAWTKIREEPANQMSKPTSNSMGSTDSDSTGSPGAGQKRKPDWQPAHQASQSGHPNGSAEQDKPSELIPRIRRRKPA